MVDTEAQAHVIKLVSEYGSMRKVAKKLGVNMGHVWRSKKHGIYSPILREALGLHPYKFELVETCQECGKVHKQLKTCPNRTKKKERHRRHIEFSSKERAEAFDSMMKYFDYKNATGFLNAILDSWIDDYG